MKLKDTTYKKMIEIMQDTYVDWVLSGNQYELWRHVLASKVSDEFFPRIISEWISNESKPPKTPADLVHYLDNKLKKQFDSADTVAQILINSARNAYYVTEDFEEFTIKYENSFEAAISGRSSQDAYIINDINKHSSNPKVLIMVYDDLKGEIKDCFTGDAEHGVEFLRNHIKKSWNTRLDDTVKDFLVSGISDISDSTDYLEA